MCGAIDVSCRVVSTPVITGHVQVHDDDVGRQFADEAQRRLAVVRLSGHLEALLLEETAQPAPEEIVVVHEKHAQAFELLLRTPILGG